MSGRQISDGEGTVFRTDGNRLAVRTNECGVTQVVNATTNEVEPRLVVRVGGNRTVSDGSIAKIPSHAIDSRLGRGVQALNGNRIVAEGRADAESTIGLSLRKKG